MVLSSVVLLFMSSYKHFVQNLQCQQHPLIFALLNSKTTFIYRKVFEIVRNNGNFWHSNGRKLKLTDFEQAIISAIETEFPE